VNDDVKLAFAVLRHEPPGLEVRVNFGVFAGRAVTPAEIDELAAFLLDEVGAVTIVSEERHELDRRLETSVHLVRIELAPAQVPENDFDRRRLEQKVIDRAEHWARNCIAHRKIDGIDL
jgi:hypothetical protein